MFFESSFFKARIIDASKKKKQETNETFKNDQEKKYLNISLIRVNILQTITLTMTKNEDLLNNLVVQELIN